MTPKRATVEHSASAPVAQPAPVTPVPGQAQTSLHHDGGRAVAGNTSPVPGTSKGDSVPPVEAAGGRAEVSQDAAGSARDADSAPLAGSRTYTITLPAGLALLSLNDRGHWAARYRRSEALKKAAWALALQQRIPRLERVSVVAEYQPGDLRRRDPDNISASAKAAIDGLRAAGCLPEDDSRHVAEVTCRIGALYPKGRLVLHLTEVAATGGGA